MSVQPNDSEPLLTPAEVAAMFRVDPKTVTRWAKAGKLSSVRTLGGHRRYLSSEVKALLEGVPAQRPVSTGIPSSAETTGPVPRVIPGQQPGATQTGAIKPPPFDPAEVGGLEPLPPPPPSPGSSGGLPTSN